MARINIYIPDDRKPEVDAAKGQLNLSQVFIEAFDRALGRLNVTPAMEDSELNELIDRLRKQRTQDRERGWKDGAKAAMRLAQTKLRTGDFEAIADGKIVFGRNRRCNCWVIDTFFDSEPDDRQRAEHDEYQWLSQLERYEEVDILIYLDGYDEGFTEQIKTIWEQIRSKVTDDDQSEEQ